jgi:hypothetical protein
MRRAPAGELGIHDYVAGSIPAVTHRYCTNKTTNALRSTKINLWMLLRFLRPDTIRVTSCPANSQLISSAPILSGFGAAACGPSSLHQPLRRGPLAHAFTLQVGLQEEIIAVSRLKACMAVESMHGSPRCRSRPRGPGATATPAVAHPGIPAATKRVSFSDPLVASPSQQE